MSKSIDKRIRKIEAQTEQLRQRIVLKDFDGRYYGECGKGLSQEQFDAWAKQLDANIQLLIVEFSCAGLSEENQFE